MPVKLESDTLSVHILNVGDGDAIIIELPEVNGERGHIVVDSYLGWKTVNYLHALGANVLKLVVATHPHRDHILGLKKVLEDFPGPVEQFWDSGFRHNSSDWYGLIEHILSKMPDTIFIRPTSGLSTIINGVDITVLAPSINLRNRYDTYGININNSSIVLRLTYKDQTVILAADAQFESWAKMTEEFPHHEETKNPFQHIIVEEGYYPLDCHFLKVAHHGSKHGTALEAIEKLKPNVAAISCGAPSRWDFPHDLSKDILAEVDTKIYTTGDGSIVFKIEGDGSRSEYKYYEAKNEDLPPPNR
jgi:beta-lactamase superfamily II metal-dependent hydrolase